MIGVAALDRHTRLMIILTCDVPDGDACEDQLAIGMFALAIISKHDDRMRLHGPSPSEDDLVGRITFDDIDVIECRFVLGIG